MKNRLTLSFLFIAAVGIALSSIFGVWTVRNRELSAARQSLVELLDLMDAQNYETDPQGWAAQLEAAAPDKRLTILSPDGTVLSDTYGQVTENHANRPEFQAALSTGWGESIRKSDTTGDTLLYEAKRFTDGNVGRISMPISSVNVLVLQGLFGFLGAAVVSLLLTLLLARRLALKTARPLEEQAEKLELEGEKLKNVRSEFAANVSHELKTPLTSIKGFIDMLSSGMVKDPEDQKRFITMIGVEADRLIELINDVLKISELESVVMPQPGDHAAVREVAEETRQSLLPTAQKAGVSIALLGDDAVVAIAPGRLREMLTNLMENSIKYNVPGGSLEVRVKQEGARVSIAVVDTGIGIPQECRDRVFERFYRVDRGRTRKTGGTGLGLAIVKHIVLLYGGTIRLESELGKGTTITVVLKAA